MTPTIRPARDADIEEIRAIYDAIVTGTHISFEDVTPSHDELARRMSSRPRLPWLVAESQGHLLGYACASRHHDRAAYRWSADSSVYVAEASRGRGVGGLLVERLIAELRDLGYVSLFAGIALPNPPSIRLHENLGFRPVGVFANAGFKLGAWHDVGWWSLALVPALPGGRTSPGSGATRGRYRPTTPAGPPTREPQPCPYEVYSSSIDVIRPSDTVIQNGL
jgi:L-amino acid N-acyltransferase YncA